MTSLLSARKRAEEFSAAVDGRTGDAELRPELAELLGLVDALRAHEAPTPRAEFSAQLRERLVAEAESTWAADSVLRLPQRRGGARERRIALVASSVVLVGGTAGLAAASQDALPGDVLYPVKRAIERAQADIGTSTAAKGQELLDQADNRLVEVRGLLEESADSAEVPGTVEMFTAQAQEGSGLLLESFEESRDPAVIDELRGFTADALPVLEELAGMAPAEHQDELAVAAAAITEIDRRAAEACTACDPGLPVLEMPEPFLVATEVERAMEGMQRNDAGNSHPALPGDRPRDRAGSDGSPGPDDGQPGPGLPGTPAIPEGPADAGTRTPRDLDDVRDGVVDGVVDGVRGGGGGVLDDVGETVDDTVEDVVEDTVDDVTGGLGKATEGKVTGEVTGGKVTGPDLP